VDILVRAGGLLDRLRSRLVRLKMAAISSAEVSLSDCRVSVREAPSEDWDAFVMQAPDASLYHLSGWTELAERSSGTGRSS